MFIYVKVREDDEYRYYACVNITANFRVSFFIFISNPSVNSHSSKKIELALVYIVLILIPSHGGDDIMWRLNQLRI